MWVSSRKAIAEMSSIKEGVPRNFPSSHEDTGVRVSLLHKVVKKKLFLKRDSGTPPVAASPSSFIAIKFYDWPYAHQVFYSANNKIFSFY